ncbi:hypothetical protein F7725_021405 [Dissostichus mawsoni]|uniref:Uncharacterized protein n=1 Tax=Dissostichus mawsoni TaxID=36200 RepID=A0A7J5ZBB4_DISMA|nr:hypothetical protein F7725_021405 [Dissostichus mawsoni]
MVKTQAHDEDMMKTRAHGEDMTKTQAHYVGEVSQVEDVVELDCSWEEDGGETLVQGQGQLDQGGQLFRRAALKLRQDGAVSGLRLSLGPPATSSDGKFTGKRLRLSNDS